MQMTKRNEHNLHGADKTKFICLHLFFELTHKMVGFKHGMDVNVTSPTGDKYGLAKNPFSAERHFYIQYDVINNFDNISTASLEIDRNHTLIRNNTITNT